jgi:ABC-type multidrug transport system fused ATPase/permease subunit
MLLAIVTIYLLKAIFLMLFTWFQLFYVAKIEAELSRKLYHAYLKRDYNFFTKINSSELIRNITEEVSKFTYYIIQQGLTLFLETIIVIFISVFLFFFNPKITFLLLVFCLAISLCMIKFTKKKISEWAKDRQFHAKMKIQHIQQGIGAIKEIKILGNEQIFLNYYDKHNKRYASISHYFNMVTQSPRIVLEFFAILFFTSIIAISYLSGVKNTEILITLGVFSAAAFRLIPSFNRLNTGIQNIRYGKPSIEILYKEKLNSIDKKDAMKFGYNKVSNLKQTNFFNSKIKVENLNFGYNYENVLENVNLEIDKNSIIGIVGKSGSGKSTFVDLLLGLYAPVKGKIYIDNKDLSLISEKWRKLIGYVPQSIYLIDDTLRKNIAFGEKEEFIDDEKILNALKLAQLDKFVEKDLKHGINTNIGERGIKLSGGQRQRIGIARILYKNPQIIILDEATSALDIDTEKKIINTIDNIKLEKTIFIISHRESALKICDQIYEVKNKKLSLKNL